MLTIQIADPHELDTPTTTEYDVDASFQPISPDVMENAIFEASIFCTYKSGVMSTGTKPKKKTL